jgi:hypothetical protein
MGGGGGGVLGCRGGCGDGEFDVAENPTLRAVQ